MHIPRHNPLRLPLILILLIGLSINGCGNSEFAKVLIEEEADPLLVTIIDEWRFPTQRPEAEILADRILRHETEGFYFDIPRHNQLVGEIERVLSLIRAAYPPMSEIHVRQDTIPGMLEIYPEPDFYEILKEMIEDKQGQIRFETGNPEFDALNAKLGVQEVQLGDSISKNFLFYFDRRLNLRVAREAYSMVKGVRRVSGDILVGDSADIQAFKQGETWSVIFRNAWGDCPSGCIYEEFFHFIVTGTDVELILVQA